jgi:hypothetical protein
LAHQNQRLVLHLVAIRRAREAADKIFAEPVTLIQLPQQQAPAIRGDPATLKISDDFLMNKTFNAELVKADCFQRTSLL